MEKKWFETVPSQLDRSLDIMRIAVALITMVHPVNRIIAGDVHGFGEFLTAEHFPFGLALAWFVTLFQLAASLVMIVRRLIVPACIGNIIIFIFGIVLDHAHSGWFVVGGGTNGMEYSVMLIACHSALLWAYWPRNPVRG
ncbi:MAG: hypothetical protein J0H74_15970 [Chitinophagaceae bacterium]|nr:hypothetical protein [Chitinophagaceae bacterium]